MNIENKKKGRTLTSVDENVESLMVPGDIVHINDRAALKRRKLKHVHVSNGVQSIGFYAFAYCTTLVEFTMPDTIEKIGIGILLGCVNLKKVLFSSKIDKIPPSTFKECFNIEYVEFPYGVKSLEGYLFEGCSSLKQVILPESIESIASSMATTCHARFVIDTNKPEEFKRITKLLKNASVDSITTKNMIAPIEQLLYDFYKRMNLVRERHDGFLFKDQTLAELNIGVDCTRRTLPFLYNDPLESLVNTVKLPVNEDEMAQYKLELERIEQRYHTANFLEDYASILKKEYELKTGFNRDDSGSSYASFFKPTPENNNEKIIDIYYLLTRIVTQLKTGGVLSPVNSVTRPLMRNRPFLLSKIPLELQQELRIAPEDLKVNQLTM